MKNQNFLIVLIACFFTFSLTSCLDDDGIAVTPLVPCTDYHYYGFKAADMSNTNGTIEVVTNSSGNFNTATFNSPLTNLTYTNTIANNSATYDKGLQKMAFVDQWNGNNDMFVYDFLANSTSSVSINSTNFITAPEFLNGTLYVLEVDLTAGNAYLKSLALNGTLSAAIATIPTSTFPLNPDPMNNWSYSCTDGVNTLYFLGRDHLLTIDMTAPASYVIQNLPSNGTYSDIVYTQNGDLLSVARQSSTMNLVSLDITGATLTESILQSNLDINPESVALVYKECGDRLHIVTHMTFNGNPSSIFTKIHEINILSNVALQKDFPGWMFGVVHKAI